MITKQQQEDFFQKTRAQMGAWYGPNIMTAGGCLYWTQVGMKVLAEAGLKPMLQAGTMMWPMIRDEDDDGVRPTHFGYEWTPNHPFSKAAIAKGLLPEVHIWLYLLSEEMLVDFSTGAFADIAVRDHGFTWTAPRPPEYIFGDPPPNVFYRPYRAAILHVWEFIFAKMLHRPAVSADDVLAQFAKLS